MSGTSTRPRHRSRLRFLGVALAGSALSVFGFLLTRDARRHQVETQFQAAARERSGSVIQGLEQGFEDIRVLQHFFEASDDVTRADFAQFAGSLTNRHPYVQAFQWLPEINPGNRSRLEAEGRKAQPGFRYFRKDAGGNNLPVEPGTTFHAVQFVSPLEGNEVTLGYSASTLATRQETLERALRTGKLSASGRVRLLQEKADQAGVLVMMGVRDPHGRIMGVAQGVFRMGDLVRKSLELLEPAGVDLRVTTLEPSGAETLLHQEPSPVAPIGPSRDEGLRFQRTFDLAGRRWCVTVVPAGGHFSMGTPRPAWIVLLGGLAFSGLLAGYVMALLTGQEAIRTQVELRTRELAQEMESHRQDALALRQSEARFRQLIDVMGEGLWVVDALGVTTFVNRRMAEMLGYAPADIIHRPLEAYLVPDPDDSSPQDPVSRFGGHSLQQDLRFRRKDGGSLWTITTGTPVRGEDGQLVSILGVVTDITERRRQQQAHLESQKLESLGILAGGIAHDFNNLLTAILGNINLAQHYLPQASPGRPYLENMELAVQRATNLTRQMLAYSGKGRFVVGPLDLNQAVREMSHLLGVSISKKVELRFQLQDGLPALQGEASQIQQVVMNLVTNASEAIGEFQGTVSIRTGLQTYDRDCLERDFPGQVLAPGPFLTLEVSDTGQGMSQEVQSRIFEPFFTTKFTGRGLGLSAMQGIVRGHKGGIRLYSEVGQGTTFKLIFPAAAGAVVPDPAAEGASDWLGQGTILVVDDEAGVRQIATDMLGTLGFETLSAADGLEALERFQGSPVPIRAVLMDLTMPRLDGVETFRRLRQLDPSCCVILTSGYNRQEAIQDFIGKGLADFVQKPFHRAELMAALRRALVD